MTCKNCKTCKLVVITKTLTPIARQFVENNVICPVKIGEALVEINGYANTIDRATFIMPNGGFVQDIRRNFMEAHDYMVMDAVSRCYETFDFTSNDVARISHMVKDRLMDTCGWIRMGADRCAYDEVWVHIASSITKQQFESIRKLFMYANKAGRDVSLDLLTESFDFKYGEYTVGMLMGKILELVE